MKLQPSLSPTAPMAARAGKRILLMVAWLLLLAPIPAGADGLSELKDEFDTYIQYKQLDLAKDLLDQNQNVFDDFADRAIKLGEFLAQDRRWVDAADLYREALRYPSLVMEEIDKRVLIRDRFFEACDGSHDGSVCKDWHTRFGKQASQAQLSRLKSIVTQDYQPYLDDPLTVSFPTGWEDLARALQPNLVKRAEAKRSAFQRFKEAKKSYLRTVPQRVREPLEKVKPKQGTSGYAVYEKELAEIVFFELYIGAWKQFREGKNSAALNSIARAGASDAASIYTDELTELRELEGQIRCETKIAQALEESYQHLNGRRYEQAKLSLGNVLSDSSCRRSLSEQQRSAAEFYKRWSEAQLQGWNRDLSLRERGAAFISLGETYTGAAPSGYDSIANGYFPLMDRLRDLALEQRNCQFLERLADLMTEDYQRPGISSELPVETLEQWSQRVLGVEIRHAKCRAEKCQSARARDLLASLLPRAEGIPAARASLEQVQREVDRCDRPAGEGEQAAAREEPATERTRPATRVSTTSPGDSLPEACSGLPPGEHITWEAGRAFQMLRGGDDIPSRDIIGVLGGLKTVDKRCRAELWLAYGDFRYARSFTGRSRNYSQFSHAMQNYRKAVADLEEWGEAPGDLMRVCRRVIERVCEGKQALTPARGYTNAAARIQSISHACAKVGVTCDEQVRMTTTSGPPPQREDLPWFELFFDAFKESPPSRSPTREPAWDVVRVLRASDGVDHSVQKRLRRHLAGLEMPSEEYRQNLFLFILALRATESLRSEVASLAMNLIDLRDLSKKERLVVREACRSLRLEGDACR